jgi:hypothetical protein
MDPHPTILYHFLQIPGHFFNIGCTLLEIVSNSISVGDTLSLGERVDPRCQEVYAGC